MHRKSRSVTYYTCSACDYASMWRCAMVRHDRSCHARLWEFVCEICSVDYKTFETLRAHVREAHPAERMYECLDCKKAFKRRGHLEYHERRVHLDTRPFECEQCPARARDADALKLHVKVVHLERKDCVCSYCGKSFMRTCERGRHVRTVHLNIRPYKCDKCEYRASEPNALRRHEKRHASAALTCPLCPKMFRTKRAVERHVSVIHEKIRPFKCGMCDATFGSSVGLNRHFHKSHLTPLEVFPQDIPVWILEGDEEANEILKKSK